MDEAVRITIMFWLNVLVIIVLVGMVVWQSASKAAFSKEARAAKNDHIASLKEQVVQGDNALATMERIKDAQIAHLKDEVAFYKTMTPKVIRESSEEAITEMERILKKGKQTEQTDTDLTEEDASLKQSIAILQEQLRGWQDIVRVAGQFAEGQAEHVIRDPDFVTTVNSAAQVAELSGVQGFRKEDFQDRVRALNQFKHQVGSSLTFRYNIEGSEKPTSGDSAATPTEDDTDRTDEEDAASPGESEPTESKQ